MYQIDRHAHTNRWRHRHPVEKLTLALGMLLLSLLLPPYPGALLIFSAMTVATVGGAGIPLGAYLRLLLAPAGFALAGAATMVVSLTIGPGTGWHFTLSPLGITMASRLLLRSLAAVSCLYCLALTTPVVDLLPVLRRWRVPEIVIDLMLLIYRFLFVLTATVQAMRVAQAARLGYGSLRQTRRSLSLLAAALFGQVLGRARRLETGLAARGYDGRLLVLSMEYPLSRLALGGVIALEVLIAVLSLGIGGAGRV